MEPKTINQHYFPRISLLQNVDVSTILMEQHCEGGFVLWDLRGSLWYCVVSDSTFYVATPWELVQKLSAIHYFWHVGDLFDSFGNEPQRWHEVVNQYSTNFVFKDCSMIKKHHSLVNLFANEFIRQNKNITPSTPCINLKLITRFKYDMQTIRYNAFSILYESYSSFYIRYSCMLWNKCMYHNQINIDLFGFWQ